MFNKGFKYIKTNIYENGEEEIILESKHKMLQIYFNKGYTSPIYSVSIDIRDKKTNQNKHYHFTNMNNHNLPKKYEDIIAQYIIMYELAGGQ